MTERTEATRVQLDPNDPEDVDVERREWEPTEAQFTQYRARELELARENVALGLSRRPRRWSQDTLHSPFVLFDAVQAPR